MGDLTKNNNGSETNGANGSGVNDKTGATGKFDATGLSAAEL